MRRRGFMRAWCRLAAPVVLVVWVTGACALADSQGGAVPPGDSQEPSSGNAASSGADTEPPAVDVQLPAADAQLPWSGAAGANHTPADIRELLPSVSEGDLAALHDGEPIDTDGEKVLYRLLDRMPGITPLNFERLAVADDIWTKLADQPSAHRVAVVLLSGRAKRVDRIDLPAQEAERYAFDHYFRVTLAIDDAGGDDAGRDVVLYARRAPSAWPVEEPIDEPVTAYGLFFKLAPLPTSPTDGATPTENGDDATDSPALSDMQFVFVGNRVAWFPESVDSRLGVTEEHVLLARLGMDIGLLDDLRELNGKPLGIADREPLYQMLAAVSQCERKQLAQLSAAPLDMAALITQPEKQHGRLMTVEGVARRITRIDVPDPDIRERFGIEAYYEVEVFVPLGNLAVPILGEKEDAKQAVIDNRYPVTVFVTRLPSQLAEFADETGDQKVSEEVRASAFSYRAWSYHSPFARQFGKQTAQVGPILIGGDIELTSEHSEFPAYFSAVVATIFLVALGSIWLVLWRTSRKDARVGRKLHGEGPAKDGELR